jgi:hypothetical protein
MFLILKQYPGVLRVTSCLLPLKRQSRRDLFLEFAHGANSQAQREKRVEPRKG